MEEWEVPAWDPSQTNEPSHIGLNDIDATGECCCNGCIGEGPCDLELGGHRDDYPSADEYGWHDDD